MAREDSVRENVKKRKDRLLRALEDALGVVTLACKHANISRKTHYQWQKEDPEYKAAVEDIAEVSLDMAESQLHKQIVSGNTAATIFYLKTKGKQRGYVERQEIDVPENTNIKVEIVKRK